MVLCNIHGWVISDVKNKHVIGSKTIDNLLYYYNINSPIFIYMNLDA